jgi:cytochrome c
MHFNFIPNDIPLPIPTGGLEVVDVVLTVLLVVAWLVHILFINVLIGASTGSVYFNKRGARENNPVFDKVAYLLTTPVTISENMGALWGVAPLLLISVMFTPLFYAAAIMNSPQWLHIIYGNIAAFLLSYLYKYTWHKLEHRKSLHIAIGTASVGLFLTLPLVFMATVQLYMTPTTWTENTHFWDALFRSDTFFRLVHFYLASFAVTGLFMMIYGTAKRKSDDELTRQAGDVLVNTGKSWFLVPTVLNLFAGPLVLFHFPSYGIENFFNAGWYWLIILGVASILGAAYLTLKDFFNPALSGARLWSIVALAFVTVLSMATLRHGMRLSLTGEAMAQAKAQSDDFVKRSKVAFDEAKNAPKTVSVADVNPGMAAAEKNGCLACHAVDQKLVGPAYKDVVAQKGYSEEQIIALIYAPKPENWPGFIPMPPQAQVSKEDAAVIAKWISGLK